MRSPAMRMAVLLLVVACAASGMGFAQETAEAAAASKIVALENAWNRASETKDLKALDQILDDAIVAVDLDGRVMTKAEILKDVKESGVEQIVAESTVTHMHGDTAIATGIYQMKGMLRAKPFLRRGRFVDTWLLKDGRWVAIASLSTPLG